MFLNETIFLIHLDQTPCVVGAKLVANKEPYVNVKRCLA